MSWRLKEDCVSPSNRDIVYGRKGDEAKIISNDGHVWIVELLKDGSRFAALSSALTEEVVEVQPEKPEAVPDATAVKKPIIHRAPASRKRRCPLIKIFSSMSDVKIRKAKIKDGLFLDVEYTEQLPGHSKKDTKLSCTVPVNEDLIDSFKRLHRHLAVLCDEVKVPKSSAAFDTAEFEHFGVRGFSIGGSDESEGVTISGYKDGKYGVVNLNSPFKKFDGETADYPFLLELSDDIDACIQEVNEYLFEGKRAPEKQIALEFGEEGEENEDEE